MISMLEFWLGQGAHGFRIDAINHLYEIDPIRDEIPIDKDGDLTDYENYYHNFTMNQVSLQLTFSIYRIR